MSSILPLLFDLLWIAVGFAAVRWLASRSSATPRQATIVAISVVGAFTIGAVWPFSDRTLFALPTGSAPSAPATSVPATSDASRAGKTDVSAICRGVGTVTAPSSAIVGSLDTIGTIESGSIVAHHDGFLLGHGEPLVVTGWAADAASKTPAKAACLLIDGRLQTRITAFIGLPRPDVAAALQSDALNVAGYQITLDTRALTAGVHRIRVAAVTAGGAILLPQQATVTLQ